MSVQGRLLEITVVGCKNLRDTEWFTKQDPYVVLEYAGTRYRTRTDTDGGKHPSFNEKYTLSLIEGMREINVQVWNSNTLSQDDFIGSGKIFLQNVLMTGVDDNIWPLTSKSGKRAGELRAIMHYTNPNPKDKKNELLPGQTYSAPPIAYPPIHPQPGYGPSQSQHAQYPPPTAYPPLIPQPSWTLPPRGSGYEAYPAYPPLQGYPPNPYPPQPYPPPYQPYPSAPHYGGYPPHPPYHVKKRMKKSKVLQVLWFLKMMGWLCFSTWRSSSMS